jgi:hypothetical protein
MIASRSRTRRSSDLVEPSRSKKAGDLRHGGGVSDWLLAPRGPIEVFDEYSNDIVCLAPGQRDPSNIEGLLIDFRYVSRDDEISRRSLLCWQCWRTGKRIYVRGYCPFREALRTFRVDRMGDLLAMQSGRYVPVDDAANYFSAYAADRTKEITSLLLDSSDD